MLVILGLALGSLLLVAAIHNELRNAAIEVTLSNGVSLLVNPDQHRSILWHYQMHKEADDVKGWDEAVLEFLRSERPQEWKYLVRSLGYHVANEGFATHRTRPLKHITLHR